jgi:hypothetical protein
MNPFQAQLKLGDQPMAEVHNELGGSVPAVQSEQVSVEEFLIDRSGKLLIPRTPDWGDTHTFQVEPWNET